MLITQLSDEFRLALALEDFGEGWFRFFDKVFPTRGLLEIDSSSINDVKKRSFFFNNRNYLVASYDRSLLLEDDDYFLYVLDSSMRWRRVNLHCQPETVIGGPPPIISYNGHIELLEIAATE